MQGESRGAAERPLPRRDGISVRGTSHEVVSKLIQAAGATGGWCELEGSASADRYGTVFVNAAMVRFVADED
jgi:hypothetical protein